MNNTLYPIFIKPDKLNILIVGGGYVGLEKLTALINNNKETKATIIAPEIRDEIKEIAAKHHGIELIHKPYDVKDIDGKDIVIAGTCIEELNHQVYKEAKEKGKIVNVADTPHLCDFYMCSIVQKGDLKIGISTNGKSPTLGKRLKELFNEVFPDSIQETLDNLVQIRDQLKGDFEYKVKKLNEITSSFSNHKEN